MLSILRRFDEFVPFPSVSHDNWEFLSKKTGTFLGILQHICAPVVGEMKGLWFIKPQTTEKCGGFELLF